MSEYRVLLEHIDQKELTRIDRYMALGGYDTASKVIGKIPPDKVKEEVKRSLLRGRGGAGFVTGVKWGFIPQVPSLEKYLVCNCDESEPGTFKDRLLVEKDPHQLIEGMILASYAISAKIAFIYCRGEYFQAIATLKRAIEEAKGHGFLGKELFGTSFSLEIIVHPGAGAYIAGEETALLNSLEGYRATPRLKPPFPAVSGLYGKPTIVNNVETLCNVVHIMKKGADWFLSIGTPNNHGTKIFQVSGHVNNPGCFEFPLGVTLQELLDRAGGTLSPFKACYPGGSSCSLLTAKDLSISMDFDTLTKRGSALGTASIIVMDESADMVKVAHRLIQFYQNESCGKCTPCREGTRWITQMLERILDGKGSYYDLETIENVALPMGDNSFCPLATGAAPPILSALKEFREEFERWVDKNPLAKEKPKMRVAYPYV